MQDDLSGAFVAGETWWALGGAIARVGAWRGISPPGTASSWPSTILELDDRHGVAGGDDHLLAVGRDGITQDVIDDRFLLFRVILFVQVEQVQGGVALLAAPACFAAPMILSKTR